MKAERITRQTDAEDRARKRQVREELAPKKRANAAHDQQQSALKVERKKLEATRVKNRARETKERSTLRRLVAEESNKGAVQKSNRRRK